MQSISRSTIIVAMLAVLCACDQDASQANKPSASAGNSDLPAPHKATGSITGMPDRPGPGEIAAVSGQPPHETNLMAEAPYIDLLNPETATSDRSDVAADDNPANADSGQALSAQSALSILRAYYAAIDARRYEDAYRLWSDAGRGSHQSIEQFRAGFATTEGVVAQIAIPGPIEAAAGSRYIVIPISLRSSQKDGGVLEYTGTYTLRASTVEGATADQREWRIASADLREAAL